MKNSVIDFSPIRPVSDLQKRFSEIEELAAEGPVRLTKNGKGAYFLLTDEVMKHLVEEMYEDMRFELEILEGVRQGVEDIEAGRYYTLEEGLAKMNEIRASMAGDA